MSPKTIGQHEMETSIKRLKAAARERRTKSEEIRSPGKVENPEVVKGHSGERDSHEKGAGALPLYTSQSESLKAAPKFPRASRGSNVSNGSVSATKHGMSRCSFASGDQI